MEFFLDPKNPKYQMLWQGLADRKRMEVIPLDGHKLAIKIIEKPLRDNYDYDPSPADPKNPLVFRLGESYSGPVEFALSDAAPHCCIAGTTGSGKSVCLRILITSMILSPNRVDVWLIDLKGGAEFFPFAKCERVVDYARNVDEGFSLLRKLQELMIRRYDQFAEAGVNSIDNYNALDRAGPKMRRNVLVVDEFAEFAARKSREAQEILKDLLRRARAAGIHVVVATQRPDADVMDGQIRANMPTYICFLVSSSSNSLVVLGHGGAELLPGHGRGILRYPGRKETEFQGYYLSEGDCEALVRPTYIEKKKKEDDTKGVYKA